MGRFVANSLGSLSDGRKNAPSSLENLARVIRNCVVNNDKLSGGPPVSALVLFHVRGEVVENIPG